MKFGSQVTSLLDNLDVVLLLYQGKASLAFCPILHSYRVMYLTFHFSISSCRVLYCLSRSSRTFFKPSEFVLSAGLTSLTVRSTSTPFIMRKHLRSCGRGSSVSSTNLRAVEVSNVWCISRELRAWDEPRSFALRLRVRTCALLLLARHRRFFVQLSASSSCSFDIASEALRQYEQRLEILISVD